MQTAKMVHLLERSELFTYLEEHELETLSQMFEQRKVAAGEVIHEAGSSGGELFIIASGAVVLSDVRGERRCVVERLESPHGLGVLSLLCPGRRMFEARAEEDAVLLELTGGTLRMLETSEPMIALKVLRGLRDRASSALDDCHDLLKEVYGVLREDG